MLPELTHATVAFLADALETEHHPLAALARWVADTAGQPTQAGLEAVVTVADFVYGA
jgi:hypothetical protein